MATFRVATGIHIQADHEWEPSEQEKKRSEDSGVPIKAPSRTYRAGEVFESDVDMVAKHGPKFALVSQDSRKGRKGAKASPDVHPSAVMKPAPGGGVFPAGQVSEGFQQTTSGPDGKPVTGLASDEVLEEIAEQGRITADDKQKKTEAKASERGQGTTERQPMKFGPKTGPVKTPPKANTKTEETDSEEDEGDDLDSMTVSDLRDYAHKKGIELKGVIRKDEIVEAIRTAESEE